MLDQLGKMKDLYQLKKQADSIKKQMQSISTVLEHKGFKIEMKGDQTVEMVWEDGEERKDIADLFNKALKESQKVVAKKMKNQLSSFGMPGF